MHRRRGRMRGRGHDPENVRLGGLDVRMRRGQCLVGPTKAAEVNFSVVGIDPGIDTGWAEIVDGKLVRAGLGDPRYEFERFTSARKVYIECPRIYPTGTPNPNDLIKLAVMVGRYDELFRGANLIAPSDWKGQLPKEVTARRARARFPDLDKWLVGVAKSKQHNVLDAIGIACLGL